jgi:hypothetical protein
MTGEVSGVLENFDGPLADTEVRFQMSDDATVVVRTDAAGAFYIPCVYPNHEYRACVGSGTSEQCFTIGGPKADFHRVIVR